MSTSIRCNVCGTDTLEVIREHAELQRQVHSLTARLAEAEEDARVLADECRVWREFDLKPQDRVLELVKAKGRTNARPSAAARVAGERTT